MNNMEYTDKEYCLEVWGDWACFTRPELKVERVSYDVITPSAARSIFEAILFKRYAMRWQITKIEMLNPIKWTTIRRNEVGAVASRSPIFIEDKRQQKNSLLLQDVRYRIYAKLIFIPVKAPFKAVTSLRRCKDSSANTGNGLCWVIQAISSNCSLGIGCSIITMPCSFNQ